MTNPPNQQKKSVSWDIEISILTNRRVWFDMLKIGLIVYVLILVLFGVIFGAEGEWNILGMVAMAFPIPIAALFLIGIFGLTAITGNRFRMHYEIVDQGIICTVTDKRARFISRGTGLLGLAVGNILATGVGITGIVSEDRIALWSRITTAKYDPRHQMIDLIGSWRSLLVVYCSPEIYNRVAEIISKEIASAAPIGKQKPGSSLWSLLLWTIAVIVACLPLFALPRPFEMDLFVPIVLLCFAVACVWFLPALGYVVLLGVLAAGYQIIAAGLQRHSGVFLDSKYDYTGFESLRSDEWVPIMIAFIGLIFLIWFAIRTIRGKGPSAFYHDIVED